MMTIMRACFIEPANILMNRKDDFWVADFGMAHMQWTVFPGLWLAPSCSCMRTSTDCSMHTSSVETH